MVIQYVASIVILIILFGLLIKILKDRISIISSIIWVIFWSATLLILWFPNLLTRISTLFGVGRGVDILIYLSIILLFYMLLNQNIKIDKLEKQITKLVREIAKNDTKG